MSLPKERQIEIIISHKQRIVELTNKILEIIHDSDTRHEYTAAQRLELRKLINETVSEITTIVGFCGRSERNWATSMTQSITLHNLYLEWYMSPVLKFWCTMANSIIIDFNKTPFKFFGGDLKLKLSQFEAEVKGVADRREEARTKFSGA